MSDTRQQEREKILAHFEEIDPAFALKAARRALAEDNPLTFEGALIEHSKAVTASLAEAREEQQVKKSKEKVAEQAKPIASARPTNEVAATKNATQEYKKIFFDLAKQHGRAKALGIMERDHNELRLAMIEEANS